MRTAFLAVLTALLLAPAAQAAPLVIGTGDNPGLAVDTAGTAYIAWNGPEPVGVRSLHFCRLPRGATACQGAATIAAPVYSLSRPLVTVAGTRVRVTQTRYGFPAGAFTQDVQFTSADGGNTFDAGTTVGNVTFDEAIAGPNDTVVAATNAVTAGAFFQSMPTAGDGANLSSDHLYNGAVGITPAGQLLTVFADASDNAQFRVNAGGDPNDAATWGAPVELGNLSYAKLASGASGLFLMGEEASRALTVRTWNGSAFGAPVGVGAGNEAPQAHISQDPTGVLHLVWPTIDADGFNLHYATSSDGAGFFQSVLVNQSDSEEASARVQAAPDHIGLAVWVTGGQVRAAPVGADQPVFGKTVVVRPVSGTVRVKVPGAKSFVDLAAAGSVPFGSSVDVKRGRLALSAKPSKTGKAQSVQLYQGQFKVTRSGKFTQFSLNEVLASCRGKASAAAKKPKTRRLWGDGKGSFRTAGRYSAATVRGTRWLVQDTCAGTLTRVVKGAVAVRDNVRHKTILLRAGKRYLARPRR